MSGNFLIYGATGYTGKLIARTAKALGLDPILAARNAARLKSVAGQHGFEQLAIDLEDGAALRQALSKVDAVLHVAGPFSQTFKPMLDACIQTGTHYLDVTGELDVFIEAVERGEEARKAGIMIMPGVGFDVVPSDCLALHLKNRLPNAKELSLAIDGNLLISRGSARTGVQNIGKGPRARRDGEIVFLQQAVTRSFDFGGGPRNTISFGLGDLMTAFYSTGIPNITIYMSSSEQLEKLAEMGSFKRWLLTLGPIRKRMMRSIEAMPEGPNDMQRHEGYAIIMGEAVNAMGERVSSRLRTPEGYTMTAMTSIEIVRRVLAGAAQPGFWAPAQLFGADFITEFDGVTLDDL